MGGGGRRLCHSAQAKLMQQRLVWGRHCDPVHDAAAICTALSCTAVRGLSTGVRQQGRPSCRTFCRISRAYSMRLALVTPMALPRLPTQHTHSHRSKSIHSEGGEGTAQPEKEERSKGWHSSTQEGGTRGCPANAVMRCSRGHAPCTPMCVQHALRAQLRLPPPPCPPLTLAIVASHQHEPCLLNGSPRAQPAS